MSQQEIEESALLYMDNDIAWKLQLSLITTMPGVQLKAVIGH